MIKIYRSYGTRICSSHRVSRARTQSTFDNVPTSNTYYYVRYGQSMKSVIVRHGVQSLYSNCTMFGFSGKSRKMYMYIVGAQCAQWLNLNGPIVGRDFIIGKRIYILAIAYFHKVPRNMEDQANRFVKV